MKTIITELSNMHHTDVAILCVFIILCVASCCAIITCWTDYLAKSRRIKEEAKRKQFTIWKP